MISFVKGSSYRPETWSAHGSSRQFCNKGSDVGREIASKTFIQVQNFISPWVKVFFIWPPRLFKAT